jgi:predicted nuclease of predicted toxin-antitoxin system
MARLYSNENFPLPVVEELRQFGHDVLTIQEAGVANQEIPDEEVLAFATSRNRAVLTINRKHFLRLHKASSKHAGIVVCTLDLDFKGQARRIHDAIQAYDSLKGKLLRINRPPQP